MSLTKFSLKRPVTTLLVVLALAVFGISSLLGLRLELMPDMDMPVMMVMTIYPGADPESVEELVSSEIEGKVGSFKRCGFRYHLFPGEQFHGSSAV